MAGICPSVEKWPEEGEAVTPPPALQNFISEEPLPVFQVVHTTVLCLGKLIPGNLLGSLTFSTAAHPCSGPIFDVVTLNGIIEGI